MSFRRKSWDILSHEAVRIFLTLSSIFSSGRERRRTVRPQEEVGLQRKQPQQPTVSPRRRLAPLGAGMIYKIPVISTKRSSVGKVPSAKQRERAAAGRGERFGVLWLLGQHRDCSWGVWIRRGNAQSSCSLLVPLLPPQVPLQTSLRFRHGSGATGQGASPTHIS